MYIILYNVWRNTGPEIVTAMFCAVHHVCWFVDAYQKWPKSRITKSRIRILRILRINKRIYN